MAPGAPDEARARRQAAVAWLDAHTNLERDMPGRAAAPTLERISALCALMGDPQLAYPAIHVTGTNGKGSTVRMISGLLQAKGLTVGSYTSPDLHVVNERLARDGEPIDDDALREALEAVRQLEDLLPGPANRFELLTAAAFRWFADIAVDVAVVEVGLGGRWDATNVVEPEVAVVTNVSDDHLEILGPGLADVAREKAGIVKAGSRVVVGETDPELASIFLAAAAEVAAAEVWRRGPDFGCDGNTVAVGGRLVDLRTPGAHYDGVYLSLHGAHQGDNAAAALAAVEAFFGAPLAEELVMAALGSAQFPGRLEVVRRHPMVVLDGAHNPAGAASLGRALADELRTDGPTVAVAGMLRGRDPVEMLARLRDGGVGAVECCPAPSPRAMPPAEIAAAAAAVGLPCTAHDGVSAALHAALARVEPRAEDAVVVVTGSLYVVAEARAELLGIAGEHGDGAGPGAGDRPGAPALAGFDGPGA